MNTGRGHAMPCIGYIEKEKVFIVRNSWGKHWGDNGYCYIPDKYLIPFTLVATVGQFEGVPISTSITPMI